MESAEASVLLQTVDRVKAGARSARRAYWFPLAVFGAVVLGAVPFYRRVGPSVSGGVGLDVGSFRLPGPLDIVQGFDLPGGGVWASLYWLIALPLGYVATAMYFRRRAQRTGVEGRTRPYVLTGLGLFLFLVLISPGFGSFLRVPAQLIAWQQWPFFQGLTPLLTIALGLFVLAGVERSAGLAAFSVAFLGVAIMCNTYNVENLFYRLGLTVPAPQINVILPGAMLLLAGGAFRLATGRST
jgi:hypothetical protein